MGKWKTCFGFSTFPSALIVEAVGMWESRPPLARFPRGSWKEGEACLWLSTLSTAPSFPRLCALLTAEGPYKCATATTACPSAEEVCSGERLPGPLAVSAVSPIRANPGLQILALVSDFQLELPPLKAHQHAAELLPSDLSTIDV